MSIDRGVIAYHKIVNERKIVVVTCVYRGQILGSMWLRASFMKPDKLGSMAYRLLAMQP